MLRIVIPLLLVAAVPFSVVTWWRMRKSKSEAERLFIRRTHTGVATFAVLAVLALTVLPGRERMLALPLFFVVGLGIRQGIRKGRARLQSEQADPFARMKRVN